MERLFSIRGEVRLKGLCQVLLVGLLLVAIASEGWSRQPGTTNASSPDLVLDKTLFSQALDRELNYSLYLPPDYALDQRRYPVLYWLHGSGGYPEGLLPQLAGRFHRAIEEKKIPPLLVVFPDGFERSMWVDSKDGSVRMETFLVTELLPHVDAQYRTVASRRGRLVEGGSMGGYGAARLGLKHPDLFAAVSMLNPGPLQPVLDPERAPIAGRQAAREVLERVYGGDLDYFYAQSPWFLAETYSKREDYSVAFRHYIGGDDPMLEVNRAFSKHLNDLGIDHQFEVLEGVRHSPASMFGALGDSYWEFFRSALEP